LAIIILFYVKSIQLYYKLQNKELKVLVMSSIAGFTTYVTHGILNNFLDTDKASLPFWGFMAVIVAIDVYYKNKPAEIEG
jgi:putative inorganic carbon (HCO3(-)) transporter